MVSSPYVYIATRKSILRVPPIVITRNLHKTGIPFEPACGLRRRRHDVRIRHLDRPFRTRNERRIWSNRAK